MIERRPTVSIKRATELTGVTRRTIYVWIAQRKVEWLRTAGGAIRIVEETLWREGSVDAENAEAPCPDRARAAH